LLNLWFALPVAALLGGLCLHFGLLRGVRGHYRKKQFSLISDDDSETAAGRGLLEKIDRVRIDLKAHRICTAVQPVLLLALVALYQKFNSRIDLQFLITSSVACGIVFFFCLWHLIKGRQALARCRLSYNAQVDVGRTLDNLFSRGYFVFHGFAADSFDIDHVVVGPKGVFAVETKALAKPASKHRNFDVPVTYNGHVLFFPKGTDEETVPRAESRAELLSNWLSDVTGNPISARAVVAIPGWLVKRTTSEGVPVVNPNQFSSLFEHIQSRPLSEAQIGQIVNQLEHGCRNEADRRARFDDSDRLSG